MRRLLVVLRRCWLTALKDPLAVVQLVTSVLLVIVVLTTLGDWLRSHRRPEVEVPLLIVGVLAVLQIVLRTKAGFPLSVAVLIIGTVVAGDRFMLAVTALLRGQPGQSSDTMKFVTDLYGKSTATDPIDTQRLAREMVDRLKAVQGNPEAATQVAEQLIDETRISAAVSRVNDAGARTPLSELARGGPGWQDFVERYSKEPFFQTHMEVLRTLGLVEFSDKQFAAARITSLGKRVAQSIDERPVLSSMSQPLPSLSISGPTDSLVTELDNKPAIVRFEKYRDAWYRFTVNGPADYELLTSRSGTSDIDTVLTLFRSDGKTQIARDDDSGSGLFSKIARRLDPGVYLVKVSTLDGKGECKLALTVGKGK